MTKFIRKNQKKLLAVFVVFLMISFVATTGTGRQGGREHTIGTYDHGKSTLGSREFESLSSQWRFLRHDLGQLALSAVLMGVDRTDDAYLLRALGDPRVNDQIIQML